MLCRRVIPVQALICQGWFMWAVTKDLTVQRVSTHDQGCNMIVSLGCWKLIRIHPADVMGTFLLLSPYYAIRFFLLFSTCLVRLYIAGLPLRSCPDYWATFLCRGSPNVCFFVSGRSRIRTHVLIIRKRYPIFFALHWLFILEWATRVCIVFV